jgi:hypothetical protein
MPRPLFLRAACAGSRLPHPYVRARTAAAYLVIGFARAQRLIPPHRQPRRLKPLGKSAGYRLVFSVVGEEYVGAVYAPPSVSAHKLRSVAAASAKRSW